MADPQNWRVTGFTIEIRIFSKTLDWSLVHSSWIYVRKSFSSWGWGCRRIPQSCAKEQITVLASKGLLYPLGPLIWLTNCCAVLLPASRQMQHPLTATSLCCLTTETSGGQQNFQTSYYLLCPRQVAALAHPLLAVLHHRLSWLCWTAALKHPLPKAACRRRKHHLQRQTKGGDGPWAILVLPSCSTSYGISCRWSIWPLLWFRSMSHLINNVVKAHYHTSIFRDCCMLWAKHLAQPWQIIPNTAILKVEKRLTWSSTQD